jgi:VWFA-related protein
MRKLSTHVAACALAAASAFAQAPQSPVATLHVESRLVVVDVVVTGSHRKPATGLSRTDFTILEDGKPQAISFFEAHSPPKGAPDSPTPPPHQYSNVTAQTPSSINVVLFDVLNTPLVDQPYARRQMLQFLKTLPRGEQVALFELGTQLRMIAGFNTTSEELIAAAYKLVPHSSELLDTRQERAEAQDRLALLREGSPNQEFFDRMQQFMTEERAGRDQDRATVTADELLQLARALAGFRGRKNIIWLSEEFPVYFGPAQDLSDARLEFLDYADLMHDTAGVLSSSQISVYPIDVRGLIAGLSADATSSAREAGSSQVVNIESLHTAMDDLAKETGGRAYYNTNDLKWAMQRSFENGSHYYTLAYVPANHNWDSKYRKIKVTLSRRGLDAEYRKGYFATPEHLPSQDEALAQLLGAVQPATPQATALRLEAEVLPPDPDHSRVRVTWLVDPANVLFSDAPGNRKTARLQMITVAWDNNLKQTVHQSNTVELSLPPDRYAKLLKNGLSFRQELKLPPGIYHLRLGTLDEGSKKIGTLDIPLAVADLQKK